MKSVIKLSEGPVREIEVEVPAEKVDEVFAEIYHRYRKEANIPGVRPGRVPLTIIKSKFHDAIYQDVLEDLIRFSYSAAVKEQNLDVISLPSIPKYELEEGKPLTYTARVEVMPVIEKVACDGLQLPTIELTVEDSEVNDMMEYLRKKNAKVRKVDRPAAATDVLTVDLVKLEDPDNILKGTEFKGNEIDLSSPLTVREFRELLPGMKPGEEKEITVNYPADYSDERFVGKTLKYICRVNEIKEVILPEITDAFAKQIGGVETMLELRLKMREDLKKQKEADQNRWKRNEIVRQIVDKNEMTIPKAMIDDYLERVVKDREENYRKFDEAKIREEYRPTAIRFITWNLLFHRLAELENIEVLSIDTENWIKRFAENYRMEIDKAREVLAKSNRIPEIRESLLEDKVFDFFLSKVTYLPAEKPAEQKPKENEEI